MRHVCWHVIRRYTKEIFPQDVQDPVFVDFLRDPEVDPDTGEELEANLSCYEAVTDFTVLR